MNIMNKVTAGITSLVIGASAVVEVNSFTLTSLVSAAEQKKEYRPGRGLSSHEMYTATRAIIYASLGYAGRSCTCNPWRIWTQKIGVERDWLNTEMRRTYALLDVNGDHILTKKEVESGLLKYVPLKSPP